MTHITLRPTSTKEIILKFIFITLILCISISGLVHNLENKHRDNITLGYSLDSATRIETTELLCLLSPQERTENIFTEADKEYCKEFTKNNRFEKSIHAPARFLAYIGFTTYKPIKIMIELYHLQNYLDKNKQDQQ
jgi:hypothetical protein